MRKRAQKILMVSLIYFCGIAAGRADTEIITVGDSITSGLKLNGSGTSWFCPPTGVLTSTMQFCNGGGRRNVGGYQPFTRNILAGKNIEVNLYNWGFAGEESWQLLTRVSEAMDNRASDYVFVMAGVNDLNDNVSVNTTVFNVQQMILRVLDRGRIPVLGTITPHFGSLSFNPKIQQINALLKSFAEEQGVAVSENYSALIGNWPVNTSGDGLHLSSTGDLVMSEKWVAAFEESETRRKSSMLPSVFFLLED